MQCRIVLTNQVTDLFDDVILGDEIRHDIEGIVSLKSSGEGLGFLQ